MALSAGEKELLKRLIQGGFDGSNSDPKSLEKLCVSLQKKGLVRRNFGNPGSGFRRKRRGTQWDGRWELAVSADEARAAMAVEALEAASQEEVGERAVFKGGTMKLSVAMKGFELTADMAEKVFGMKHLLGLK